MNQYHERAGVPAPPPVGTAADHGEFEQGAGHCIECDENYRDSLPEGDVRRIVRPMIVCPTCGNKRCPKATRHTFGCTGSNEPGQQGSAYPMGRHLHRATHSGR